MSHIVNSRPNQSEITMKTKRPRILHARLWRHLPIGASESQELCLLRRSLAENTGSAFWFALRLLPFAQPLRWSWPTVKEGKHSVHSTSFRNPIVGDTDIETIFELTLSCTIYVIRLIEFSENTPQQECFPVRCVPSTAVALGRGASAPVHAGICLSSGGVYSSACWDVSAQGVSAPVHAGIYPPVNRMNDRQV